MNRTTRLRRVRGLLLSAGVLVGIAGCGGGGSNDSDGATTLPDVVLGALDPAMFKAGALSADITTESCTLIGGTETTCYRITTVGTPADAAVGPFCPPTITASADEGGIWFDGSGNIYPLDGAFIANLATLYNDVNWLLYDPATNLVNVTDTEEKFEGAAQPTVAPEYQQQCVQGTLEWIDGGIPATFLIPVEPVPLTTPAGLSGSIGVSLNGIQLAAAAPVDAILGAYTIAAFDDCGGHLNPHDGYHYHGSTGCTETGVQTDGHAALLGYAMDGYGIYGMLDANGAESTGLDECRGETDAVRGYHYHSASAGENMFIGCFHGDRVATGTDGDLPPNGPPPR